MKSIDWEYLKTLTAWSCFVMTSAWVVWNFSWIIVAGQSTIGFENYGLNILELLMALGIMGLAIERLVHFVIMRRRERLDKVIGG